MIKLIYHNRIKFKLINKRNFNNKKKNLQVQTHKKNLINRLKVARIQNKPHKMLR